MIRVSAVSTDQRKRNIMEMIRKVNHNQSPEIKAFGIEIGTEFIDVPARQLPPPLIEYANGKVVRPAKGVWQIMSGTQFLKTSGKWKWFVLNTDRFVQNGLLQRFAREV